MTRIRHFLRNRAALAGLERSRPQAPDALVGSILLRIEQDVRARRGARARTVLAGALTATLATALFTVGGVSYAANAANGALKVAKKAFTPTAGEQAIVVSGISAGGDQYRPGFGFGDPNHNHTARRGSGARVARRHRRCARGRRRTARPARSAPRSRSTSRPRSSSASSTRTARSCC